MHDGKEAEIWSSQDKFHIVIETAGLSEIELADYCRSKRAIRKTSPFLAGRMYAG